MCWSVTHDLFDKGNLLGQFIATDGAGGDESSSDMTQIDFLSGRNGAIGAIGLAKKVFY